MSKILFVTEKWCDFNPNLCWTNSFHNLFSSFNQYGNEHTFDTVHLDEAVLLYNSHIDNILPEYCQKYRADIVIFCLINGGNFNPSIDTYVKLKNFGCQLAVIWPDTGPDWGLKTARELAPYVDLQVSWDNPRSIGGHWDQVYNKDLRPKNHVDTWTPEDELLYFDEPKTIDISWVGSNNNYRDRTAFCDIVKANNLNIYMSGGQRQGKLTPYEYAKIIRTSKIGINFPLSQTSVFYQAKGRIFEYTASNALLFEIPNPSTDCFFEADKDYVSFTNFQDLFDKIQYYLEHEQERLDIAEHGHNTFKNKWTGRHWWNKFFEDLGKINE